ncbi:DNA mismatch repair protein MutS [Salinarimonas ramus]|uniref:DNA mismatch repair protein MutS n=2 Tax=Salinarimonas ramus TaxID=690164 RepID=A0A917Q5F4_9HYPH|nr:DNA mismatch repair protein MutS [Salinarimonas ramus]
MMAQYVEIKAANADSLLFYRMGDFYELFFEDAEIASRALGIVLTKRGKHLGQDIPMCGVPIERADDYLQRLIGLGHRVAVCEQMEDPAEAKKRGAKAVVRRDVVRLVTPGTITEERLLEPARASLLVAVARRKVSDDEHAYGIAAVDITTGVFQVVETARAGLGPTLARLEPREIVLADTLHDDPDLAGVWREIGAPLYPLPRDGLDAASAERRLKETFGVATLDAFGAFTRAEIAAAGTVLAYVERTQIAARPALRPPAREDASGSLVIDAATRANLELTRTLSGERAGSLLAAIDRTLTPGGGRLLAERLAGPLTDIAAIRARQDAVARLVEDTLLRDRLRERLASTPDMSRALGRLALDRGGPRDLAAVRDGLAAAKGIAALLGEAGDLPAEIEAACRALRDLDPVLEARLAQTLADELPLSKRDGGFVAQGIDAALDEARALGSDSRRFIAGLQARYAEETGCRTLRIKHNAMLGYYLEVPAAFGEELLRGPLKGDYIHRQTMSDAMRFTTLELGELERAIASASERAVAIELSIFTDLAAMLAAERPTILAAGDALSAIDVAASLADLASERAWSRPKVDDSLAFLVEDGRHPVVEAALAREGKPFIANACDLSGENAGAIAVITGPNMGGKSTYLRQNALVVVLAQMGAFVPASRAHVGVCDRLFSRVGAADDLARGRSTFMVEMVETAAILNQATRRSLVILDEIGRGTATFDGLSIAWAAIEHLHEDNRCRALFATHFHELTRLTERFARIDTLTLKVAEHAGQVIFLHEVVKGAADRSYGLQVAKLAGLPLSVVARAGEILAELERTEREHPRAARLDDLPLFAAPVRRAPAPAPPQPARDALREVLGALDPDEMTPKEALEALYALKAAAKVGAS